MVMLRPMALGLLGSEDIVYSGARQSIAQRPRKRQFRSYKFRAMPGLLP